VPLGTGLIYGHLLKNTPDLLREMLRAAGFDAPKFPSRKRVIGARIEAPPFLEWQRKKARCYLSDARRITAMHASSANHRFD
jgi:hypothetical protein